MPIKACLLKLNLQFTFVVGDRDEYKAETITSMPGPSGDNNDGAKMEIKTEGSPAKPAPSQKENKARLPKVKATEKEKNRMALKEMVSTVLSLRNN